MPLDLKSNPLPAGPNIQGSLVSPLASANSHIAYQQTSNFGGRSPIGGSIAGATIGTLGNLFGDWLNYKRQKKMYERQRQDALADYDMQREDYLEDLASERAYNSPVAQKARLMEAGINPNIAFGNGNVANTSSDAENTAGVRSSVFASPASNSGLGSGLITSGLDMIRGRDLESGIVLRQAETYKALVSAGLDFSKKQHQDIANSFARSMYASEIAERNARTNELIDNLKTSAETRLKMQFERLHLMPAQVNNINAAVAHYYAQVKSINQQIQYFDDIKETRKRTETNEMFISNYKKAQEKLRSDIFKEIGKEGEGIINEILNDAFLLRYAWNLR